MSDHVSGKAMQMTDELPMTPAARLDFVYQLARTSYIDEDGNEVQCEPVITVEQAFALLEMPMDDETKKVLQETWFGENVGAYPFDIYEWGDWHQEARTQPVKSLGSFWDDDRARIAACAPEFARMHLEMEWVGPDDGTGQATCFWCGWCIDTGAHTHDCRWHLLAVKAGVR